jgi:hypothetical protein
MARDGAADVAELVDALGRQLGPDPDDEPGPDQDQRRERERTPGVPEPPVDIPGGSALRWCRAMVLPLSEC